MITRHGACYFGVARAGEVLLFLSLCLLFAAPLHAEGGVGGAVQVGTPVGPNEAVFFDGRGYRVGSRNARVSFTLPDDQLYAIVRPMEFDPAFDFTESLHPPKIRSIVLGANLAVLVRYGWRTYVDLGAHALVSEIARGNFRIFERSESSLSDVWGDAANDFIFYRREVWPHGPPGVAFCRWNRHNEINDDTWMACFVMANDPEAVRRIHVSWRKDEPNLAWVELFGKGTQLHLRIQGQGDRVLTSKSDGGGRENTYNLRKVGMSLDDVEWAWVVRKDPEGGESQQLECGMKITAPVPKWTPGSGWSASPNVMNPGMKVGGAEAQPPGASPPPAQPPGLVLPVLKGVWRQQAVPPMIPEAQVVIGESAAKPGKFACRIAKMKIFGLGTLRADGTLEASFGTANANMTGIQGPPRDTVKGKVAAVDAQNRATRLEWANGVVYVRIQ